MADAADPQRRRAIADVLAVEAHDDGGRGRRGTTTAARAGRSRRCRGRRATVLVEARSAVSRNIGATRRAATATEQANARRRPSGSMSMIGHDGHDGPWLVGHRQRPASAPGEQRPARDRGHESRGDAQRAAEQLLGVADLQRTQRERVGGDEQERQPTRAARSGAAPTRARRVQHARRARRRPAGTARPSCETGRGRRRSRPRAAAQRARAGSAIHRRRAGGAGRQRGGRGAAASSAGSASPS